MIKAAAGLLKFPAGFRLGDWVAQRLQDRRLLLRIAASAVAGFLIYPYAVTPFYLLFDPPFSALTMRQTLAGKPVIQEWRDLDLISPNLVTQVIVSEDARFCEHWGVDWSAIDTALDAAETGRARGASTLSMQTAKNLFLWNKPAIPRKILELPLAYYMDFVLGKKRVMELYLNVAEWGPGIFGAEAAAQHHFHVSSSELTSQEAAQLAAALPNPKRRNAGQPSPRTFALANHLRARAMRERTPISCVLPWAASSIEVERDDPNKLFTLGRTPGRKRR